MVRMNYLTFLDAVIARGIEGARKDYATKPDKLAGSVAGFEACRDKTPTELRGLLAEATKATSAARRTCTSDYWKVRCYEIEIEWVCNCVSVLLKMQGLMPIVPPTARAALLTQRIVGVNAPN